MLLDKVRNAIEPIRPYLQADRGDIEVVDISDDYIVKVRLTGACEHCDISSMTLKAGVEQTIKKSMPFIARVEEVHAC